VSFVAHVDEVRGVLALPAWGDVMHVEVFLGKGGVGKTTCAAATALHLADAGTKTLIISTDPTPSLCHIFEVTGAHREREIRPGLSLTELGAQDVRAMWDERFGHELYSVFAAFVDIDYTTFVQFVTAVLPGLNEEFMADYIRRLALDRRYERILWDTAPLGQTLALLGIPAILSEHLRTAPRIYSHLRTSEQQKQSVMQVIRGWQELAAQCMEFLRHDVRFSMVTIPEALAVEQLDAAIEELKGYGLAVSRLIINNVIQLADSSFLRQKAQQQRRHLERLHERFHDLPITELPLLSQEVRGTERLRSLGMLFAQK
jgi:arsenite/tail-anchored protein-transporting ATPase